MRALTAIALSSLILASAGCGWSPPSGPQAKPDTCRPADGPTAETVNSELTKLPAAQGGQWRETARGHTTDCRLHWVQVSAGPSAPDSPAQVLFFDHDSPIGTPTPDPRPYVAVVNSGADTVTVQYQWRQGEDQPCCPTGIGTARFQAGDGMTLKALDPIPGS
jgi:LppP/LprE lipoprotein